MPDMGGVSYDLALAAAPDLVIQGYTKTQRDGLNDDMLIKVCKEAVKCNLPARLTKGLQVTTFNPANLKSNLNFFNFVTQWESTVIMIKEHVNTLYIQCAFQVVKLWTTPPDPAVLKHGALITLFLRISAPTMEALMIIATLSRRLWLLMALPLLLQRLSSVVLRLRQQPLLFIRLPRVFPTHGRRCLNQVVESVNVQLHYIADPVHRQNLAWSYEYLQKCLDYNMGQYALSQILRLSPEVGRTGPVLFMIVAQRLVQTTENLVMKVINGLIALRLTYFDSESIPECIFTLRNVLKFLRYGEVDSFAPRTTVELVYNVFRGSSVPAFCNYVQQVQDITLGRDASSEAVFDQMQSKYEELLLSNRWVPKKKTSSAFFAGNTTSYEDAEKEKRPHLNSNGKKNQKGKLAPKTHDKSGKKIDRTPPKSGEPHKRELSPTTIVIKSVPSADNTSDIFTKALPFDAFARHCKTICGW